MRGQQGSGRPVSTPILVYKVYPDGREELVRGLRFRGFNARSLKDILAAGDDSAAFEFMDSTGAVRADRRRRLHGRGLRGGALDPDRRSGAASGGRRAAQAAGGVRRRT